MPKERPQPEICVVGGGLSGLATVFYLRQQQQLQHANIRLIEAQKQLGGEYIQTEYADAGLLQQLLQQQQQLPHADKQGAAASGERNKEKRNEFETEKSQKLLSLVRQVLQDRLPTQHLSVAAGALRGSDQKDHFSTVVGNSRKTPADLGSTSLIPMEFGAGAPHLLAPGGGHVLRLLQQLLLPSQLVVARRQAASVFSLVRSSSSSSSSKWLGQRGSWTAPLLRLRRREHATSQASSAAAAAAAAAAQRGRSRPGLSRLNVLMAIFAGLRESCLTKEAVRRRQATGGPNSPAAKDMSVAAFAELHSCKAFSNAVLLPAFSACSYAGDAAELSAAAYFPRAWLLQQQYGSLLRGCLAERRLARKRGAQKKENSPCSSSTIDSRDSSFIDGGGRIVPVEGCKAFPKGHEAVQRMATEGAGVFTPVGGMRQLVEALKKSIMSPSSQGPPVSVVLGSPVVRIEALPSAGAGEGKAAEVVCEDGARYPADVIICAMHPHCLGRILMPSECGEKLITSCAAEKGAPQESACGAPGGSDTTQLSHAKHETSGLSTMANFLTSLPCASWITVHAFGAHSSRRASSLGRGCVYSPSQLDEKASPARPPFPSEAAARAAADEDIAEALKGLEASLQAAQDAVVVAELQLPGNLFPHLQAAALAAAERFDRNAVAWATKAELLHVQASVRVQQIEALVNRMQHLLLPLQRLLHPHKPSGEQQEERAAGLLALGLLISSAEEAVTRLLLREGIILASDRLVMCSRLLPLAELQWPVTIRHTQNSQDVAQPKQLLNLVKQFESLRDRHWGDLPVIHAALSELTNESPPTQAIKGEELGQPVGQSTTAAAASVGLEGDSVEPYSFADARLDFHKLRVRVAPWLQVVGASGSLSEWGPGARVKDAAILAHQIGRRFAAFPSVNSESCADFVSRLNGGWLDGAAGKIAK